MIIDITQTALLTPEQKMETHILLVFDVDTEMIHHRIKDALDIAKDSSESVREALRCSIETVVRQHLKEEHDIKLILSTTNINPRFSNVGSTQCTVHHIPGDEPRYFICGDSDLCKDLRKKIGSEARLLSTDPEEGTRP